MTAGFRTIQQVLGKDTALHQVVWPTWAELDRGSLPILETSLDAIRDILKAHRLCLLSGGQAQRKTVTAKLLGHRFAMNGWLVWYAQADRLEPREAFEFAAGFDRDRVLFIVDDCHKAIDDIEWFLKGTLSLRAASFLFVSRSVGTDTASPSNALESLRRAGAFVDLTAGTDLIRLIVEYDYRSKAGDIPDVSIAEHTVARLATVTGGDLEILDWLLKSWSPRRDSLDSVVDEGHLYRFVASRRLKSASARAMLLPTAALYQFEIPVQTRFLGPDVERFVRDGLLTETVVPLGRCEFVQLSHASLASLYLRAAEWNDLLDRLSVEDYSFQQLRRYLSLKPLNYYGLFRGLYFSRRPKIVRRLCLDQSTADVLIEIAGDRPTPLTRVAGLTGFLAKGSPSLAIRFRSAFFTSHEALQTLADMSALDEANIIITMANLKLFDFSAVKEWVAGVTPDSVVGIMSDLGCVRACGLVFMLAKCGWNHSNVSAAANWLEAHFESELGETSLVQVRFILKRKIKRAKKALLASRADTTNIVAAAPTVETASPTTAEYVTPRTLPVQPLPNIEEIVSRLTRGTHRNALLILQQSKHSRTLRDQVIRSVGLDWFLGAELEAGTASRLLSVMTDEDLRREFIARLTREKLRRMVQRSSPLGCVHLLQRLTFLDQEAAATWATTLTEDSTLDWLLSKLSKSARGRFVEALAGVDEHSGNKALARMRTISELTSREPKPR